MSRLTSSLRIFDYRDYRQYLDAFYKEQKGRNRNFSYRYFASRARISSIGLYKDVVDGRQNLSRHVMIKFSEAMGHTKKESEYFEAMVFFNDAKTADERKFYSERMTACIESIARTVETSQAEAFGRFTAGQIDMSTLTLSVSKAALPAIKDEIALFRKKMLNIAENDPGPDCVYQFKCHFFPPADPGKDVSTS